VNGDNKLDHIYNCHYSALCLTLSVPGRDAVNGSSRTTEISSIRQVRQQSKLHLEDFGAIRHRELAAVNCKPTVVVQYDGYKTEMTGTG